MNEVDAFAFGEVDDVLYVQIRGNRTFALADEIGLVRFESMDSESVLIGVDGYRSVSHFGRAPKDAHGDFASIGGKQFFHLKVVKQKLRDVRNAGRFRCVNRDAENIAGLGQFWTDWGSKNAAREPFVDATIRLEQLARVYRTQRKMPRHDEGIFLNILFKSIRLPESCTTLVFGDLSSGSRR